MPSDSLALIGVEYVCGGSCAIKPLSATVSITLSAGNVIPASRDAAGRAR
jgi:hypothetical protein